MFNSLEKNATAYLKVAVNEAVAILKKEIDALTPEDTGLLLSSNRQVPSSERSGSVIGAVENKTSYAPMVEYWVGRTFNYHKPKGRVAYRGVGARMFTRAFDANKAKLLAKIKESFTKSLNA